MSAQQFLQMTVEAGKARNNNLPPGTLVVTDICQNCNGPTEHTSTEASDAGGRYERLCCMNCGRVQMLKVGAGSK